MKSNLLLMVCLAVLSVSARSQVLGEFKPKDASYGVKKTKDATRIYIANFAVNYQIYNEKQKFKQGGSQLGGGSKGDAQAEASIGLAGLTETDVQQITDKLYQDFVAQIKAGGLTIIGADDAGKTDTYKEFVKLQGGTVNFAQFPGTMTTVPSGYEYYVKKVDESGKTKSGGFLGGAASMYPKLSKQLDDAIIADVNIYVLFVQDGSTFQGGGAKVKITTNLRIANQEAIVMSDHKSAFRFKGQNSITAISSSVNFTHGKMGMGATTSYQGTLGKALTIGGVIEDTKVTSFARGSTDYTGVSTIYGKYFTPEDKSNEATKIVEVDSKKYSEGVYAAAKKFIDFHTAEFLNGRK
ncbi:MAG: hypothetical protein ABIN95_00980 [Mucilaginibacter sp.]